MLVLVWCGVLRCTQLQTYQCWQRMCGRAVRWASLSLRAHKAGSWCCGPSRWGTGRRRHALPWYGLSPHHLSTQVAPGRTLLLPTLTAASLLEKVVSYMCRELEQQSPATLATTVWALGVFARWEGGAEVLGRPRLLLQLVLLL